ncbi:MAG: tRNA uridine-5-carboxymethylaminomethyl(34) synthesis enzyme MnmG [Muribaculaceae bacterium]|nr:tRNA uridine-5-carboxymethylaminomethyl(34) synthesis enzyme MnmG [Muribaculaceae bacterium]
MRFNYDIIVIGAGHAGCEAAFAAARLGSSVLLITPDLNRVAQMSCNPAVGGIAKGQIVREIDALGGNMGIVADKTAIQFRMLNRKKGPAVWSPRVQSDRTRFSDEWRRILDSTPGLELLQDMVTEFDIVTSSDSAYPYMIKGVKTALGMKFEAKKVILTAGTFLGGNMHFGKMQIAGGRIAESSSEGLTEQLVSLGFETGRMKTGTPARISGKSIDFALCERQDGEDPNPAEGPEAAMPLNRDPHKFSFLPEVRRELKVRGCYITHTSAEVHKILNDNLSDSPLYNGQIRSIGPRYCPSIETKIVTFADKDSHQLFLEPEGETTDEYYINGFSSSLPWEVQLKALERIPALRNVHFYRPGYAIEYDFFPPTQLTHDLQTRLVEGLYFAGQVNGTTGYEEAGAQGLMAGINAARACRGEEPIVLRRDQAYIGVLIDDLVTKGVDEPYRMFTSRAEYRILLRQDDADMRLTPIGYEIGLADNHRYSVMLRKQEERDALIAFLEKEKVAPTEATNEWLKSIGTSELSAGTRLVELLRRPQISLTMLIGQFPRLKKRIEALPQFLSDEIVECAEILVKYDGYIKRERELADKMVRLEDVRLSPDYDYDSIKAISIEARQKLSRQRPRTLGEASRISGVSPADISILMMLLGR